MKTLLKIGILSAFVFLLAACTPRQSTPASPTAQAGSSSEMGATATPGSMSSVEGNHMMEPINGENLETVPDAKGGQLLASKNDGDTKVFELTAKAVKWPILQ